MNSSGLKVLLMFHCPANTGYAITPLECTFFDMASNIVPEVDDIFISYPSLDYGMPSYLPCNFFNVIEFDTKTRVQHDLVFISEFIKKNKINFVFGFDFPVHLKLYKVLRNSGVRVIVSYLGAPMSDINFGIKLFLKKIEVCLRRFKPDHFIFESKAMLETAINGRGISSNFCSVIPLGVDTDKFSPNTNFFQTVHELFNIPSDRKIIFYSGHMEERKGVHVIIESANELILKHNRQDIHFLILGNKNGEEERFFSLYKSDLLHEYITFGGYREDINIIMSSCYIGVIASTGWDSFPRSALEMASCGLPLIVSYLQGLKESIEPGITGLHFPAGDYMSLSNNILFLLDNLDVYNQMSLASRERILNKYSLTTQASALAQTINNILVCKKLVL